MANTNSMNMMRRLFLAATAVISMLLADSCAEYKYETVKGDPMNTKIYTLDNGLKVYMTVNKETPRVQTTSPSRSAVRTTRRRPRDSPTTLST